MSELRATPILEESSEPVNELFQELPPLIARGLVYLVLAIFLAALIYSAVGQVDDLASARGRVSPQGFTRETKALTGGRVSRLAVREGDTVSADQALAYLETSTAAAQLERAQAERKIRERELADQLAAQAEPGQVAETRTRLAQTAAEEASAREALDNCVLLAPMSGQVVRLAVHGPGEVVQPGQVVAEVSPAGAPLVFETLVSNADVGRVRLGQRARVKVDAFPFQESGTVGGTVTEISPDALVDSQGLAAYRVLLALDPPRTTGAHPIQLKLGMTGTAEIITGRRRIIELFFKKARGV